MEKQGNYEYPEAEEVTIEIMGLDQWDKAELRPVEVRLGIYLQRKLVKSGLEESVPAAVILGVRDPNLTEQIKMLVKTTKPSEMVRITGRTKVNVEGVPADGSLSLFPPLPSSVGRSK